MNRSIKLLMVVVSGVFFWLTTAMGIQTPKHKTHESKGTFSIGGSFLYSRLTATDGDLQYGTIVGPVYDASSPFTLTKAALQDIQPHHEGAFTLSFNYQFAKNPYDIDVSFLRYNHQFSRFSQASTSINPFVQNFLGAGFSSGEGNSRYEVTQLNAGLGKKYFTVNNLLLHPHFGLSYLEIKRKMDVRFNDYFDSENEVSYLTGEENSKFRGGGVFANLDFDQSIKNAFHFVGGITSSLIVGSVDAFVSGYFDDSPTRTLSYYSSEKDVRPVVSLSERLGLSYAFHPAYKTTVLLEGGYFAQVFMNAVGRLNPTGGFVNNPWSNNPSSNKNSAAVGLSGPYFKLTFMNDDKHHVMMHRSIAPTNQASNASGYFLKITNAAIETIGQKADLNYGYILSSDGTQTNIRTSPNFGWYFQAEAGRLFKDSQMDLSVSYSQITNSNSTSANAGTDEIFSMNSSGSATVSYNAASSHVSYDVDHATFTGGQNFAVKHQTNLHLFTGIQYAHIKRTQDNSYLDGNPPIVFAKDKYPVLRSRFTGYGPIFGLDTRTVLCHHFNVVTKVYAGLLIGTMKSSLNQSNIGVLDIDDYNNLNTDKFHFMVPNLGGKLGLSYRHKFKKQYQTDIEIGYQGDIYFKGVNAIYPVFLTGLQQHNTNLTLAGPYISLSIMGI
jgi:hypothetical protein